MKEFIKGIPKAELHLHIEGTLEPDLMLALAKENNIEIPYQTEAEIKQAYAFSDLKSFLDLYYSGLAVLIKQRDLYRLTKAYLDQCAAENIVYTEIFFDPQAHMNRGIAFETALNGIVEAIEEAKQGGKVQAKLIASFLRDLSEEDAHKVLDLILQHRDKIIGVGLDSNELGNPPEKFRSVYARAKLAGLHLVAHGGEEGDDSYVSGALDALGVERIDHGNNALHNPQLMARLRKQSIPLTLCPLSNLKLKVINDMAEQPVKKMLQNGLRVTINSDDPAYFGGYLTANFLAIMETFHFSEMQLRTLVKNAFQSAFMTEQEKTFYLDAVEKYPYSA